MSDRSVVHNTFTIERTYDAPVTRVFAAFADWDAKQQWFKSPEGWVQEEAENRSLRFRVQDSRVSAKFQYSHRF